MNPSQKKKRKHRQVLDKLVLFLKTQPDPLLFVPEHSW